MSAKYRAWLEGTRNPQVNGRQLPERPQLDAQSTCLVEGKSPQSATAKEPCRKEGQLCALAAQAEAVSWECFHLIPGGALLIMTRS